ncbi:MAG: hypothetical protein Q9183_005211, partial [Haloplaca sp. 2 TL-2023]
MLACGGCLCIPSEDDRQNQLERSIVSLRVNALDLTPSTLQLLSPERLPGLRLLTLGGELVRPTDVFGWCDKVRLFNAYGPSECTPASVINCDVRDPCKAMHIGTGAGVVTWIVDKDNHDELLPPGCTGELLLEGPLVGLGYLNDAAKTAAAFIKSPKWMMRRGGGSRNNRESRLYKTGDLVKYNEDGSLVFVRRKDTQVKIRGQRVEPEEVEAILRNHGNVDDAVVVLQSRKGQDPWLAGFLTISDEKNADGQTQRFDHARGTSGSTELKVRSWGDQFDGQTYDTIDMMQPELIGRDFIGWTSMYDGRPIDNSEMNEWLDDTISTILDGDSAGHVLEIGTGSGMMLFNLASHGLESYVGVEPSERAVNFVCKAAKCFPGLANKIHIIKGTAKDILHPHMPISPNLVIMNSVIQYFPNEDYLLDIIQYLVHLGSVETIFLGDVRSYALHKEFLATRTLHIVRDDVSLEDSSQILRNLEKVEPELLLDPGFFTSLSSRISGVAHVEIVPKRMKAINELSSYRYSVLLHINRQHQHAPTHQVQEVPLDNWIDFTVNNLHRRAVSDMLNGKWPANTVAISNIPFSNISYEREIVRALKKTPGNNSTRNKSNWLSILHQKSQSRPSLSALDLAELAHQASCKVDISCARQRSQNGGLDAIFHHPSSITNNNNPPCKPLFRFPTDHESYAASSHKKFSTQPLRHRLETKIQKELQSTLRSSLPLYMLPHSLTILEKMPTTHT